MAQDHDFFKQSIDVIKPALYNDVEQLSDKEWSNIARAFSFLDETLTAHIQREDNILYEKAQQHEKENTLFYSLIAEHLQILERLKNCRSVLRFDERQHFSQCFSKLTALLDEHVTHEEELMCIDPSNLETSAQEIIYLLRNIHTHEDGNTRVG